MGRLPKQGEIFRQNMDRPYQVVTTGKHSVTGETMVVYQAMYGDFQIHVSPLEAFMKEVLPSGDASEAGEIKKDGIIRPEASEAGNAEGENRGQALEAESMNQNTEGSVNAILLRFLEANSCNKKLDILTSNIKHMNDRLINDMAVALDCAVDDGPIDQRIKELIVCLQAMARFEDRRLR